MAHRRSTTPASPAEQLAANLDTLLIEGDDYLLSRSALLQIDSLLHGFFLPEHRDATRFV